MARAELTLTNAVHLNVPRNSTLLIAVSGGLDSVSLLHACVTESRLLRSTIEVAHVDHGLRPGSAKDAEFVRELAGRYNVPFHLCRAAPPDSGVNIEAWGRQIRYDFFADVQRAQALDWILTAHTANDVAETLLMRLLSGKEMRTILSVDRERCCVRPLLGVGRDQIQSHAAEHTLESVEDESNQDQAFLRNQLRNSIIPFLERELDRPLISLLSRQAGGIAVDIAELNRQVAFISQALAELQFGSAAWRELLLKHCNALPEALAWRVVEQGLYAKLRFNLGREHSKRVLHALGRSDVRIELPGRRVMLQAGNGYEVAETK